VLIDYGLSRHDQLPDLMDEEFRLPYGTAPYMAPEQVFGIRSEPRSDLFALGALMYFFATNVRPFGDPQTLKGLKKRVWRDPEPPRKLKPDIPPWLQEIILRCLEPDPEHRHPTAAQLAFDLAHPELVGLTPRATKLHRDPWTDVIKRRLHPESYNPERLRAKRMATRIASAPIIVVAIDLSESLRDVLTALRSTVERILQTVPNARLACLNVMKMSLIALDTTIDDQGRSLHVQKIAQLKDWARPLNLPEGRVTFHVLEAVDAGAAILDYVTSNHVDHIVLGAQTKARLRNILGSVATEIVQKAPCTVTVVRKPRAFEAAPQDGAA
jgi:nucleotide-binding universal stress UspA family protein